MLLAKKHIFMSGGKKKRQVDLEGFRRVIQGRRVIGPSFEDFTDGQNFQTILGAHIEWPTFYLVK